MTRPMGSISVWAMQNSLEYKIVRYSVWMVLQQFILILCVWSYSFVPDLLHSLWSISIAVPRLLELRSGVIRLLPYKTVTILKRLQSKEQSNLQFEILKNSNATFCGCWFLHFWFIVRKSLNAIDKKIAKH